MLAFVWLFCGTFSCLAAAQENRSEQQNRPILLVDERQEPRIRVSWTVDSEIERYTRVVPFTAPVGGEQLGESNVKIYATLGGTRIETGAGHPKGAIIRVGLTKVDNSKAFFRGIDPGTSIEISIIGVRFNQQVKYHEGTGMMHLKYALGDLEACALPGEARNQYLLSDPQDTLGGRVNAGINATPGALGGDDNDGDEQGTVEVVVQPDDPTLVDLHVRVPYHMLRHLQDPWKSKLPGTFFEPIHLHAEAEMIPVDVDPVERVPFEPEVNTSQGDSAASQDS